jgi:hypothetical protein
MIERKLSPPVLSSEALERFVRQPTATITWSKEIDRIDGVRRHAVITTLIMEDPAQTPWQMLGVST